ncbi:MAG: hypothetical protein RSH25_15520 [Bacteroides sp.]|uniref:DUF5018-related domain-containing protein n=1 Tax=Bacteroides sp. TaxID=29523 RepID=UPI002FCA6D89
MKKSIIFIMVCLLLVACEPRIEMDMAQWGDHAYIDNIELVKLEIDDHVKLQEYYENQTPLEMTGVRSIVISDGKCQIDSAAFIATVKLKAGEELKYTGLKIYHKGMKVEPLNGSPKAGIISDFSKKEFTYRLKSADGSEHDWTIKIQ